MSRLRVLFVTHAYPRHTGDAAGSFLHRLALALAHEDVEVRVLAPSGAGLASAERIEGIEIRRFRYAPRGMESLAYTGTMAEQVLGSLGGKASLVGMLAGGSWALRREIARFSPDVLHAHWWFPAGLLAVGGGRGVPLVTTLHGSDVRLARKVPLVHPLFRAALRRSHAVTAVSTWLGGVANAMAPRAKIATEPMPADDALFAPAPDAATPGGARGGAAHSDLAGRFLFVGRLNAQKGIPDLLDAFARTSSGTTLDVIGGGDPAPFRARAEQLGIAARVRWLGSVERSALPSAYRAADALVIPSRDEGLGLVAVEAQLCGTPVIAYRSGGLPDVVDPAWGGTLVEPGDIGGLADAMRARSSRGEHGSAAGMANVARARMIARFGPAEVARRYIGIYERAAATGHA